MDKDIIPIIQVGDVLLSPDILTEKFCAIWTLAKVPVVWKVKPARLSAG
jgi:hypothetical protein